MKRAMSVAGSFYPNNADEIKNYFNYFTKSYDLHVSLPNIKPKAIIVPHAGYIYSGFSANIAYRLLAKSGLKNLLILGPSHRVDFYGASLCEFESYETPLGELASASEFINLLKQRFTPQCLSQAHHEHSTEVQFPFIKYYMPQANIAEIVYGDIDPQELSLLIDFALVQESTGVIISTDLSHFHDLVNANKLDNLCVEAVEHLDAKALHNGCEACGKIGVEAMLRSAKKKNLHVKILDYTTSAQVTHDEKSVVGYMSACIFE